MASYTVKKGDTLWAIAQRYLGDGNRWRELGFNGDPRRMPVGTVLNWGSQPAPAAAPAQQAPAQTATTNPVQDLKDTQNTIVDEYGKEEQKYNQLIGDYGNYAKGWQDIFATGSTEWDPTTQKWTNSRTSLDDLTGPNASKYGSYLDQLSQSQWLDPYFAERLARGEKQQVNIEDILKSVLVDKVVPGTGTPASSERVTRPDGTTMIADNFGTPDNVVQDSGIQGVGYEMLRALAEGAQIEEAVRRQQASTYARELLSNWQQAAQSVNQGYGQVAQNQAQSGLRGGVSNRQLSDLAGSSAGMMKNIAASNQDWQSDWLKNNRITNQEYAKKTKMNDLALANQNMLTNSGITNMDLKQKFLTNTGLT